MRVEETGQERQYEAIAREVLPRFKTLEQCRSMAELERHPEYREIAGVVERCLGEPHVADFRRETAPAKDRYRFLAWNIERGMQYEAQLEELRTHRI